MYIGKDETPESKLMLANINQLVDRMIDAYARAVAARRRRSEFASRKAVWNESLTTWYKYRNATNNRNGPVDRRHSYRSRCRPSRHRLPRFRPRQRLPRHRPVLRERQGTATEPLRYGSAPLTPAGAKAPVPVRHCKHNGTSRTTTPASLRNQRQNPTDHAINQSNLVSIPTPEARHFRQASGVCL